MTEKDMTIPKDAPLSKAVKIAWTFIAIIFSTIAFLILYEIYIHHFFLPFLYSLILLGGLILEFKTICKQWDRVLITAAIAMACSWIAFFPMPAIGLEGSLRIWPFVLCGIFGIATMWTYSSKTQIQLTEGLAFMQCLALVYWVIEGFSATSFGSTSYFIIGLVLVCSAFSIFHAFTYIELTRKSRFVLSFWSAGIMTFFAILNIYAVYQMQKDAEGSDIIITLLQHFFLGISSIYIVQNIYLIVGYLPSKEDWKYGKNYYKRQRGKLTRIHISRFSDKQVRRKQVFICLAICSILFCVNYFTDIAPPNLAIWVAFLLVPWTLDIIEKKNTQLSDASLTETTPSR